MRTDRLFVRNLHAIFFSDLHLESDQTEKAKLFTATLKKLLPLASHLFLLGDIFDLWIADSKYFEDRYRQILEVIDQYVKNEIPVIYIEGNHDFMMKKFWDQRYKGGVQLADSVFEFQLGPWKVRCEHGDLMNPDDTSYLRLRKFLRHQCTQWIAHHLPGSFIASFADPWSKSGHARRSKIDPERIKRIEGMMLRYASKFEGSDLDYLVTGHTHVPLIKQIEKNQKKSQSEVTSAVLNFINLGSWYSPPGYFLLEMSGGRWVSVLDV